MNEEKYSDQDPQRVTAVLKMQIRVKLKHILMPAQTEHQLLECIACNINFQLTIYIRVV